MESYEDFIKRHYEVSADVDNLQTHAKSSSVIVFHGASVLPPLLSEQQRDEMRRLRERAVSLMKRRSEEESHIRFKETVNIPHKSDDITHWNISTSNQHTPLTSTAHDGQSVNQLRAFPADDSLENTQVTVLFEGVGLKTHARHGFDNHSDKHPHGDISSQMMMMSSGYVTNENTAITCHSSWMEGEGGGGDVRSAGGVHLNMTQSTNTAGSDIINHAPVDAAILEEENAVPASEPAENLTEPVNPLEPDLDEGPYRMSLQNLLKKSQEYRRRQRLLRNQTRTLKSDDLSLSDKENEEFFPKHILKSELRKAREKRKEMIKQSDTSMCSEPLETEADHTDITNETCRSMSTDALPVEHDDTLTAEIDNLSLLSSTELPVTAKSLYLSKQKANISSRSSSATTGMKFTSVPMPKFCLSPVRSKKISSIPDCEALVKTVCVECDAEPVVQGDCHDDGGNVLKQSTEQTEQITQLELNLSSLKALISDLESTLTLSQTGNSRLTLNQEGSSPDICLKWPSAVTFNETVERENAAKNCGIGDEAPSQTFTHKFRLSNAIQTVNHSKLPAHTGGILADTSNQSKGGGSSLIGSSYDVDSPSELWTQGKQLTPEMGGHEGVSRAKRRLLMNEVEVFSSGRETSTPKVMSSVLQSSAQTQEDQVRVLMEEERRQQQGLLQSLAVRYEFLRHVSFPCPTASTRLEDTSTSPLPPSVGTHTEFTHLSDTHHSSPMCLSHAGSCRPLVAAVVKGFLTRRLLHTERVSQLIRTIKDTREFLLSFQHQTPVRGEFSSRHDLMLQERVTLQLRAARYELHDVFFNMSSCERMQLISWDRELTRDRKLKQHDNKAPQSRGKSSLSAATRKALERRRLVMLQKKLADRTKSSPFKEDKWNLVPKICRVSKKNSPLRGPRGTKKHQY
ncbi:uncharacterized protein si:ch73-100l22.3 isoform X2 [Myxocyprinus asiaticus]|uniref:uncharacterized protein si:ch73-100l22.3 isoform X2 n=1 Tax=Myxocyprinus asiaticus TaxID=70543 RepID=UPI0022223794|nr:uncharacterized protein si:ch73-100l22.3 isoform X2 [Myxocyprinus asiaticus]